MYRLLAVIAACCFVSGCATVNTMAFDKNTSSLDTSTKSVVLVAIDVSRSDDSRYVPKPFVAKLETPNAKSVEERQNFRIDKDLDFVEQDGHKIYLARMALAPGKYKFDNVTGMASAFPFNGLFYVPVVSEVTVKPHSVMYVGRITAKLRERKKDEFRAGPAIPLIDQAATGFSGGTWDVAIEDMSDKDLPLFRTTFPVLASISIDSTPLPPFDRIAAQRWWEGVQPKDKNEQGTQDLKEASAK
jgi:hypothetical protein